MVPWDRGRGAGVGAPGVGGAQPVGGASCRLHMVALPTSATSLPGSVVLGGAQWRRWGKWECLVQDRGFRESVCVSFVLVPCVEPETERPSALCTVFGLILTVALIPLVQMRLREV